MDNIQPPTDQSLLPPRGLLLPGLCPSALMARLQACKPKTLGRSLIFRQPFSPPGIRVAHGPWATSLTL